MTKDADREVEAIRNLLRDRGLMTDHEPAIADIGPAASMRLARDIQAGDPGVARSRRPWFPVGAAAAALAVVALVLAIPLLRSEPTQAATAPRLLTYSLADPTSLAAAAPAANALAGAADVATKQPTEQAAGDVQYVASYGWSLSIEYDGTTTASSIYPTFTRSWLSADGSATVTQSRGASLGDGDHAVITGEAAGLGGTDKAPVGTFDAGLIADLAQRDDQGLEEALVALASPAPCDQDARWHAECLVVAVEQLYERYVVPPDMAARLWRALADEPDLRDLGTTTDRLGRPASAVALASDPADTVRSTVTVLLISPDTGELTGTETVTLVDTVIDVDQPTVTTFTTWTAHTWALQAGSPPH